MCQGKFWRGECHNPQARYAVVYAAETVRCAFWEALGRNRFARRRRRELPRVGAWSALMVSISCDEPLVLVDLRADGPVRIGAPRAVAHDGNHAAGPALSGAVHVPPQLAADAAFCDGSHGSGHHRARHVPGCGAKGAEGR